MSSLEAGVERSVARDVDKDRIRRMLAEAMFDTRDDRGWPGFGLEDLASDSLRRYRDEFRAEHRDHPWSLL